MRTTNLNRLKAFSENKKFAKNWDIDNLVGYGFAIHTTRDNFILSHFKKKQRLSIQRFAKEKV